MSPARHAWFVVPDMVHDPRRPSGGNTYDRRVTAALAGLGWTVVEETVTGTWPSPDPVARTALARTLHRAPDDSVVVVDGLVASAAPEVLAPEATRLRLVVLVHQPLGVVDTGREAAEREALATARGVVATSDWTRRWLRDRYGLPATDVVEPGADPAPRAPGTGPGGELLCVGAVSRAKGYDVLVDALGLVTDLAWRCRCVGPETEAGLVPALRAAAGGAVGRIRFTGPLTGAALTAAYAASDLVVMPSRTETFGMVATEALAHGLPVVSSDVGGLPAAIGTASDGTRPALLVPPDDPPALAAALRQWLVDPELRSTLRRAARDRRTTVRSWQEAALGLEAVLARVAAG